MAKTGKVPQWVREERAAKRLVEIERGVKPLRAAVHKGKRDLASRKRVPNTVRGMNNDG